MISKTRNKRLEKRKEEGQTIFDQRRNLNMESYPVNSSDGDAEDLRAQLAIMATSRGISTESLIQTISSIGFTEVRHKSPRNQQRQQTPPSPGVITNVEITNKFTPLADVELETTAAGDASTTPPQQQHMNRFKLLKPNKQTMTTEPKGRSDGAPRPKKDRVPLITTEWLNTTELAAEMKKRGLAVVLKRLAFEKQSIRCADMATHSAVMAALRELQVSGFTYTAPENKTYSFLLRGLCRPAAKEQLEDYMKMIKEEILEFSGVSVNVKTFNASVPEMRNPEYNTFLVTAPSTEGKRAVTQLRYINYHVVSWTNLRKKRATQCMRCQRLGHSARNCLYDYRCIKCTTGHEHGKCQKLPNDPADCCNCGQQHPANYAKCEYIQRTTEQVERSRSKKQDRVTFAAQRITPGVSYKDAVIGGPAPPPGPASTAKTSSQHYGATNFFEDETRKQFGMSLQELMGKFIEFKPRYLNMAEGFDKKFALINFVSQLCLN